MGWDGPGLGEGGRLWGGSLGIGDFGGDGASPGEEGGLGGASFQGEGLFLIGRKVFVGILSCVEDLFCPWEGVFPPVFSDVFLFE